MLKIAVLQFASQVGNIRGNVARIIEGMQRAHEQGVDLLVTCEQSVTGIGARFMTQDANFEARADEGMADLREAALRFPNLSTLVSFISVIDQEAEPFQMRLISANGQVPAQNGFELKGVRVAINLKAPFTLFTQGYVDKKRTSDVLIHMPANRGKVGGRILSPFHREIAGPDNALPSDLLAEYGQSLNVLVVAPQPLQSNASDIYVGGSFITGPGLKELALAKPYEEAFLVAEVDVSGDTIQTRVTGQEQVIGRAMNHVGDMYDMAIFGLRDYMRQSGFKKVVVGCSGGIDSALTLALAAQAIGAENVLGITMPSRFSTEGSVSDSVVLCRNLGIQLIEHPIKQLVDSYEQVHGAVHNEAVRGLALENLQARMRAVILMTYSNAHGHLVLTTGNKSECAVGYFTMYGDSCGGLNLIGDLYKTEVFELSRYVNKVAGKELIPLSIINKAPSAELAPDQKDEDNLPPYPVLDAIIKVILRDFLSVEDKKDSWAVVGELEQTAEGIATLNKVRQLLSRSEYKRAQAAPVVRMRERSFGSRGIPPTAVQY